MLGSPIRTSPDQRLVGDSPRLNAASHVLHRLLMPRHPPCALKNLATKMLASTMQISNNKQRPPTPPPTTRTPHPAPPGTRRDENTEALPPHQTPKPPNRPASRYDRTTAPHQETNHPPPEKRRTTRRNSERPPPPTRERAPEPAPPPTMAKSRPQGPVRFLRTQQCARTHPAPPNPRSPSHTPHHPPLTGQAAPADSGNQKGRGRY